MGTLFTDCGGGIEIRDPLRKHRKIGGKSSLIADEWDEEMLDVEDTALVCFRVRSEIFCDVYG